MNEHVHSFFIKVLNVCENKILSALYKLLKGLSAFEACVLLLGVQVRINFKVC